MLHGARISVCEFERNAHRRISLKISEDFLGTTLARVFITNIVVLFNMFGL